MTTDEVDAELQRRFAQMIANYMREVEEHKDRKIPMLPVQPPDFPVC